MLKRPVPLVFQKIKKLKSELNFTSEPLLNEDDDDDTTGLAYEDRSKHKIFVDSHKKVDEFDAVAHFDTVPELMNRWVSFVCAHPPLIRTTMCGFSAERHLLLAVPARELCLR